MKKHTSITQDDFTNVLREGALLRHGDQCHLAKLDFTKILAFSQAENESDNSKDQTHFNWQKNINIQDGLYVSDFFGENQKFIPFERVWSFPVSEVQALLVEFLEQNKKPDAINQKANQNTQCSIKALKKIPFQEASFADFSTDFSTIMQAIRSGQLRKAVPITFEKANFELGHFEKAYFLLNILSAPSNLWPFGYWGHDKGIIGATPELLFLKDGNNVTSMALAGTCPINEELNRTMLLDDPKEMAEHKFVSDDIIEQFSKFGEVSSKGPWLYRLPHLIHIRTDIYLKTKNELNYFELIKSLHPTPALGIYPRELDFRWLKKLIGSQQRDEFGAPWGWYQKDKLELALVAIRNLQWDLNVVKIGSGCGVVKESQIEQEWNELKNKRNSVKKLLGISLDQG